MPAFFKRSINLLDNASVIEKVKTSALYSPSYYEIVGTLGELTSLASSEVETASGTMGGGGIVYALAPAGVAEAWWDKVVARVNNRVDHGERGTSRTSLLTLFSK